MRENGRKTRRVGMDTTSVQTAQSTKARGLITDLMAKGKSCGSTKQNLLVNSSMVNKQGTGYIQWIDGSSYCGHFKDNRISGYGEYLYQNGNSYKGEWRNNLMHGEGIFSWHDGKPSHFSMDLLIKFLL